MPVIRTADAVVHAAHGATFTSYAAPALGTRELCVWRLDVPAGTTGQPHTVTREEVLVIAAGTLTVTLDGHSSTAAGGDAVVVPAGTTLRVDNTGPHPASAWVSTTAGLEAVMPDGARFAPPWVR